MASLRRNRTMPTDGAIAKFLYTILKQLDLKSIDWNEVAGSLDITNGHAARMRFSRFKQQMEGIPTQTRKPRVSAPKTKKEKQKKDKVSEPDKSTQDDGSPSIKPELDNGVEPMLGVETTVTGSPQIKPEPKEETFETVPLAEMDMGAEGIRRMSLEAKREPGIPSYTPSENTVAPLQATPAIKEEPFVKLEPEVRVEPRWDE